MISSRNIKVQYEEHQTHQGRPYKRWVLRHALAWPTCPVPQREPDAQALPRHSTEAA